MSTRATYRFLMTEDKPEVTLFIHSDGYPEWAVENYILPACHVDLTSLSAEQFIRANEKATICWGHESYRDTEYRYDIDQEFRYEPDGFGLVPHSVRVYIYHRPPGSKEWTPEFHGDLNALKLACTDGKWVGQTFERANAN